MCCNGGMESREAPLCIPAYHFIELMNVLQSFKKGVAHTLCCIPSFWRSSGTLHTPFINVCRVQDREGQGWRMLQHAQHHWFTILTEGLYIIIHIHRFHDNIMLSFVHQITSLHVSTYLATRSNSL
ncbi:hypothetical protein E2C01_032655 [Portunus trituberculatus]|uniref:Uncharacterized protein n=1 Tax=Portunus trituberculatus TaxID=210409 RepID=A0A5B7EY19_PORTR|nr:hypothetical protein [Portunus trituberculatus]